MVPYNRDREPSVSLWNSGSIQASIVLDQPGNVAFTNLDEISGRVVLKCLKSVNVSSIIVKLEGESKTRLLGSTVGPHNDDPKLQLEYHKVLYLVDTVFPPADVVAGRHPTSNSKGAYTLPAGSHEYAWKFKLPFNNSCHASKSMLPSVGVSGFGLEVARPPTMHVKKTLPPTLSGFPGEAEVRYFVKATVARQALLKENPRAYAPFNFFPIEPPRPPSTSSQVFARQKHTFAHHDELPKNQKMKSLFGMKAVAAGSQSGGDAMILSVDARLPEPAVLTCNQAVPLSIIVKKLSASTDAIYLQSLQVSLIGHTRVRAHEIFRVEQNSWIIMSKSNMGVRLSNASDPDGTEVHVDDGLWRGLPLPNTVAPSFETCNIARYYQLDVRVGLMSGGQTSASKAQTVVLPLRLDTLIFSGIAPPAAMLERMANAHSSISQNSTSTLPDKLRAEGRTSTDTAGRRPEASPVPPMQANAHAPSLPPRPGQATEPQLPMYSDAPPSYEDAIASELPPVDGNRPDYAPPPPTEDDVLRRDEKRGWVD